MDQNGTHTQHDQQQEREPIIAGTEKPLRESSFSFLASRILSGRNERQEENFVALQH